MRARLRIGAMAAGTLMVAGLAAATPVQAATAPVAQPTDDACAVLASGASAVAQQAVRAGCAQVGLWYTWGGGHAEGAPGPTYGERDPSDPASNDDARHFGFDCSGLVRYAYYKATGRDILAGDANSQFQTPYASARFSPEQGAGPLLPGDLLVYGTADNIHHIEIYLGAGKVIAARQSGTHITVGDARFGGDYFGAVRIRDNAGQSDTFQTWGTQVWTHIQPSTDSPRAHEFAGPTVVRISCQKHAQVVTAEGITNDAWSYLPEYSAWLTNIYIKGPAWLDNVPTCA